MSNQNATAVTNFEAGPWVATAVGLLGGKERVISGTIALGTADIGASDTVMLAPIPTNARVYSLVIWNDDLDSATTITTDIGVYTADSSTVAAVDDDMFASAVTDFRGAVTGAGTEYVFSARNITANGNRLWEDVLPALTVDPGNHYYIGLLFNAAGDQAGDVSWKIVYAID